MKAIETCLVQEEGRCPPPATKTVRELSHWQYAKIISESAGMGQEEMEIRNPQIQEASGVGDFLGRNQGICLGAREQGPLHLLR